MEILIGHINYKKGDIMSQEKVFWWKAFVVIVIGTTMALMQWWGHTIYLNM